MTIRPFIPGRPIPAAHLNELVRSANEGKGLNAPDTGFAGGSPPEVPGPWMLPVAVVERTIEPGFTEGYAPLHAIGYRVHAPGVGYLAVPWQRRIVAMQPDLVRPTAESVQMFWPAAVAGSDEAAEFPWRCRGLLFRGPDQESVGVLRWCVQLWGETPYHGC